MLLRWLKDRRRRQLRAAPFPEAWQQILFSNVAMSTRLTDAEQDRLRGDIQVLVAEKNWEGCNGVVMTDEIKVTIAAQISLLVLAFEEQFFDNVLSILVYPHSYTTRGAMEAPGGLIVQGESLVIGQAVYRGPVILSWPDVIDGARGPNWGRNVVFHEFAHQLDMLNGRNVDGNPPLETREQFDRWQQVNDAEYARLTHACRLGHPTLLDCYGATNRAEFFAVATECFFQLPHEFAEIHPELYDVLRTFYKQDPGLRVTHQREVTPSGQ